MGGWSHGGDGREEAGGGEGVWLSPDADEGMSKRRIWAALSNFPLPVIVLISTRFTFIPGGDERVKRLGKDE